MTARVVWLASVDCGMDGWNLLGVFDSKVKAEAALGASDYYSRRGVTRVVVNKRHSSGVGRLW